MQCCEIVANGYGNCCECYKINEKRYKLSNNNLYKKFLKGDKLSKNEIIILKNIIKNI